MSDTDDRTVEHDVPGTRFTISTGGELAGFTQYVERGDRRVFFHTVVEDRFSGRGLAGDLVRQALDETVADGRTIVPVCPYVRRWLETHHDVDEHVSQPDRDDLEAVRAAAG